MKALMLLCSLVTVIPAAQWQAKVVGVKGGNALEVLREGKVYDVKLYGIGCLGKGRALGKEARRFTAKVFMADISLDVTGTTSDGGLIGKVTCEGKDLSLELVKCGLAWWDKQSAPEDKLVAKLEKEARDAYLGIWAGSDDEGNDYGKDVIAQRELAGKGEAVVLTSNN